MGLRSTGDRFRIDFDESIECFELIGGKASSAAGELIFHVFGAIAHFERRLISERTKDGIAAAWAIGKRPSRQPLDMKKIAAAMKLICAGRHQMKQQCSSASGVPQSIAKCADLA